MDQDAWSEVCIVGVSPEFPPMFFLNHQKPAGFPAGFFLNHKYHNYGLRLPVLGPMRRSVHERVAGSAPEAWERAQNSTTLSAIRANEPGALPPKGAWRPSKT